MNITKEKLKTYIDNRAYPQEDLLLNKLSFKPFTHGYSHDEHGYFVYEVSERQHVHKTYFETEQDCIEKLFKILKYTLELHGQTLPDINDDNNEAEIDPEEASRECIEKTLEVNEEDKLYFDNLCKSLGYEDLYSLIRNVPFERAVHSQHMPDYYAVILSDLYDKIEYYFE